MAKTVNVSSLPLKDVIIDIANELNTTYNYNCDEYWVDLPADIGTGFIRGLNFNNGLGIIQYKCKFLIDFEIVFNVSKVHPLKYIYCTQGFVKHSFTASSKYSEIAHYRCLVVASMKDKGHQLFFRKGDIVEVVSLEIDRQEFVKEYSCQIENLKIDFANVIKDTHAKKRYYNEGYYSLSQANLINDMDRYSNDRFLRHMYLQGKSHDMFIEQIEMYRNDMMNNHLKNTLSKDDIRALKKINDYIENNLENLSGIDKLVELTGLNKNKLQKLFKQQYGVTVNNHITRVRMNRAHHLLINTHLNISQTAYAVGIASRSYFSKIFLNHFKILPSEVKKMVMQN